MKASKMIEMLQKAIAVAGDVEVDIADGYSGRLYEGDFDIWPYQLKPGTMAIEIEIGGHEKHWSEE